MQYGPVTRCKLERLITPCVVSSVDSTLLDRQYGQVTRCELHRVSTPCVVSSMGPTLLDRQYGPVTRCELHIVSTPCVVSFMDLPCWIDNVARSKDELHRVSTPCVVSSLDRQYGPVTRCELPDFINQVLPVRIHSKHFAAACIKLVFFQFFFMYMNYSMTPIGYVAPA
jgi:hypothetical protein